MLGAEFGVQDTLLMRLVPDKLRGRVLTTDRASELLDLEFFDGGCRLVVALRSLRGR